MFDPDLWLPAVVHSFVHRAGRKLQAVMDCLFASWEGKAEDGRAHDEPWHEPLLRFAAAALLSRYTGMSLTLEPKMLCMQIRKSALHVQQHAS